MPLCLPDFRPHLTALVSPNAAMLRMAGRQLSKTRAVSAFLYTSPCLLASATSCKTSVEIINRTFLAMRRVVFTPNGDPDTAATRLRAARQGERQCVGSPGVLVPPGTPGEVQRATLLPFKGKSVEWPSSVTHKLLPANGRHA